MYIVTEIHHQTTPTTTLGRKIRLLILLDIKSFIPPPHPQPKTKKTKKNKRFILLNKLFLFLYATGVSTPCMNTQVGYQLGSDWTGQMYQSNWDPLKSEVEQSQLH